MYFKQLYKCVLTLLPCLLLGAAFFASMVHVPVLSEIVGLSYGLDLKGGIAVTMEVDETDIKRKEMLSVVQDVRSYLLQNDVGYKSVLVNRGNIVVSVPYNSDDALSGVQVALDKFARRYTLEDASSGMSAVSDSVVKGRFIISLTNDKMNQLYVQVIKRAMMIIRQRVDATGLKSVDLQMQGKNRILLQIPGVFDRAQVINMIGRTAVLGLHIVKEREDLPSKIVQDKDGQEYDVFSQAALWGERIEDASVAYQDGQVVVSFRLDTLGAAEFGRVTRKYIGRRMAIVLDNEVISAPSINGLILDGRGIIEGNFTQQEAAELAIVLKSGALPAKLNILEERVIGPELGADSIRYGRNAAVLALALIALFVGFYYRLFGCIAGISLLCNAVMIMGVLSVFQATLTLPGLAGVALTMGMAIDGNVLIFERLKEELAKGRNQREAFRVGYVRALRTIWDANITTILVAAILFAMTSGYVQGFALTLGIGILTSVYTATFLTRALIDLWWTLARPAGVWRYLSWRKL